jgi:hypothetical protein
MTKDSDLLDLARIMLCVQTSFIEKRIADPKYKKAFKDTALCFINISMKLDDHGHYDIKDLLNEVALIKSSISNEKPGYFSSLFNESHKYRLLAADMAEDIATSLISRFVDGDSKTYLELFDIKEELC